MSYYFDYGATSLKKPKEVADKVYEVLASAKYANASRGSYYEANNAFREVFMARNDIAKFFGLKEEDRLVFTNNSTESLNIAILGLLNKGDHVITTSMEHNSVLRPIYLAHETIGCEYTVVVGDKTGMIDYADLEKAIKIFNLDFRAKIVLDIGASTGGFTDCSLQNGAKFVYAVDVGTNQLDWKLRNDSRVKSIENKHINELEKTNLENEIDIIVMDISFISIKKVLYKIKELLKENGFAVFLIKPQFEAERNEIEKGIVNDLNVHKRVIDEVVEEAKNYQLFLENLTISPIKGTKGNIEYLAKFSKKDKFSNKEIINKIDKLFSD